MHQCTLNSLFKELIKYYRVGVKAAYTVKSLLKLTYVLGLSNRFFTIHTVWSDSHAHCIVYMQIAINARFNSMHPLSGYSTLSNLFGFCCILRCIFMGQFSGQICFQIIDHVNLICTLYDLASSIDFITTVE